NCRCWKMRCSASRMRSASAPQSPRSPDQHERRRPMLDRKAMLILPILILVTLGGAIWQVAYLARGSIASFVIPVTIAISAGALALQARRVTASVEALAAWKKWGSFFLISCAAILTAFQLLPIFRGLGIPLPSSTMLIRLLVAC